MRVRSVFSIILFGLLSALASACGGTFEVSLAGTLEPTADLSETTEIVASPTAATEPAATAMALEPYTSPEIGFSLPVPVGSEVLVEEEGRVAAFGKGRTDSGQWSFMLMVQTHLDLPAEARESAEALVEWLAASQSGFRTLSLDALHAGAHDRAVATYDTAGEACPEVQPLLAAYLIDNVGYSIFIASDTPGRCNAATLPESEAILAGFEPPEMGPVVEATPTPVMGPVMEATPTPTPAALTDLLVVYVKQDNLYLWDRQLGERQLTTGGGVDQPLLSDDGQLIAYRQGNDIWAIASDGSDARRLVAESDLPLPDLGELNSTFTGVSPYQMAWVPDTHSLMFNTVPIFEGPGLILADDLWLVEADTASLQNLFPSGQGGKFVLSPDGSRVALVQPSSIHVATVDGSDRQERFNYTPVVTYSEVQYYAQPVWAPDGQSLAVVIPPADPLGSESQVYGIWRLGLDGIPARLVGSIEARVVANRSQEPVIAPDHSRVAYLSAVQPGSDRTGLFFVSLGDTLGEPFLYTSRVAVFDGWAPDAERFIFVPDEREFPGLALGRLATQPQFLGDVNEPAIGLEWVDGTRFVFLQATEPGWDLVLGDTGGARETVTSVAGPPPAFDLDS